MRDTSTTFRAHLYARATCFFPILRLHSCFLSRESFLQLHHVKEAPPSVTFECGAESPLHNMQKATLALITSFLAYGVRQSNSVMLFFEAAQQTDV